MACLLLGTPVSGNCQAAQRFADQYARVPAAHRALVRLIEINDWSHPQAVKDGLIRMPANRDPKSILHEVGHLVGWADDSRLLRAYTAEFWRNGKARGGTVSNRARRSPSEDFADHYRRWVLDDGGESTNARTRWISGVLRHREAYGHAN